MMKLARRSTTCAAVVLALGVLLFSLRCDAILPCGNLGFTMFTPAHPQANDVVAFDIAPGPVPSGDLVLLKIRSAPGSAFAFDVIVTSPGTSFLFPDYQVVAQAMSGTIQGQLGVLPVGSYPTTTTVRTYDPATGFSANCAGPVAGGFAVYADDGLSPVIEYVDAVHDHYFLTQDAREIAALDAGAPPGWVRTGQSFLAYRPQQGLGEAVSRYYGLPSARLDTHLYTFPDFPDVFYILMFPFNTVWRLESDDAFDLDIPSTVVNGATPPGTCKQGEVPVYRLWNNRTDSDHRYTVDLTIRAQMIIKGWIPEGYGPDGIAMCAFTR